MSTFEGGIKPFRPPRSYWKQVDAFDARIYELSQSNPKKLKLGIVGQYARRALWSGSEEHTLDHWLHYRLLLRGITCLSISHTVRVDPAAEGIPTPDNTISTGFYSQRYGYISGQAIGPRPLYSDSYYVTDVHNPDNPTRDKSSRLLDQYIGLNSPDKDAYDVVLAELKRGASGEYQIILPKKPEN
jgi:hypothetical protein